MGIRGPAASVKYCSMVTENSTRKKRGPLRPSLFQSYATTLAAEIAHLTLHIVLDANFLNKIELRLEKVDVLFFAVENAFE